MKAVMTQDVGLVEWFGDDYPYDEDDVTTFKKGSEVEVLKHIGKGPVGDDLYIIYSEELKESTVVHKGLIEFIGGMPDEPIV